MPKYGPLISAVLLLAGGCRGGQSEEVCAPLDANALGAGGTLEAGCYELKTELEVEGPVVFQDGVTLKIAPDIAIEVYRDGSLTTNGGPLGVQLQRLDPQSAWRGIRFGATTATESRLTNTHLDGACSAPWEEEEDDEDGEDTFGALYAVAGSQVATEGLTISGCAETSLQLAEDAFFTASNLTIQGELPARMSIQHPQFLDGVVLDSGASISILRARVNEHDTTLPGLPYVFESGLDVKDATLFVSPGASLAFHRGARLYLNDSGLMAVGTAADPIIFEGVEQEPGGWGGIRSEKGGAVSVLDWVEIRHADEAVSLRDTIRMSISNTVFSDNAGYPLSVGHDPFDGFSIRDSRFEGNERGPLVTASSVADFGESVVIAGNQVDVIHVSSSDVASDTVLPPTSVPIRVEGFIDVNSTLEILPGADIEFLGTAIRVGGEGHLTVGGARAVVSLRGVSPQPGSWKGILISESVLDNRITNTEIRDAGLGWTDPDLQAAILLRQGARLSISDLVFQGGAGIDVFVADESALLDCSNTNPSVGGDPTATICP